MKMMLIGIIKIVVKKLVKRSVRLTGDGSQQSGLRKNLFEWRQSATSLFFLRVAQPILDNFYTALTFLVLFGSSQKVHRNNFQFTIEFINFAPNLI